MVVRKQATFKVVHGIASTSSSTMDRWTRGAVMGRV